MIVIRDAGYREELAKFTPSLRAFARALVDGHAMDAADEMVQTALLAALGEGTERRGTRLRLWLLTSVIAAHRRGLRDATVDQQAGARNKAAQQGSMRAGQWETLRRPRSGDATLLDDMPLEWRETLLLVVTEGLSYVQVAECLGTTLNTVIGHLARAREHLSRKGIGAQQASGAAPVRATPYLRVVK